MYKRTNTARDTFFYIAWLILAVAVIALAYSGEINYAIFSLLAIIPIEIFMHPRELALTASDIYLSNKYLAGLIRKSQTIPFKEIIKIGIIAPFDGAEYADNEDGSIFIIPGKGAPAFSLYQITYLNERGVPDSIKFGLYLNEVFLLKERLNNTSNFK